MHKLEACVDTHVWRVSRRLGLIGPKVNADQAHEIFARMTPRAKDQDDHPAVSGGTG
jgi:endonuclease III